MRAGIVIDAWKLPIFERHLSKAGFSYDGGMGITPDTLNLYVETTDAAGLERVVRAANAEAAESKP